MLLTLLLSTAVLLVSATGKLATVKLDQATVVGTSDGVVTQFLGIPFAEPPYVRCCLLFSIADGQDSVGKLRLQLPQPISSYKGVINATTFGNQCIQQTIITPTFPSNVPEEASTFVSAMAIPPDVPQSEDCEYISEAVYNSRPMYGQA